MRPQNNFTRTTQRLCSKHIRATEESKIICLEGKAFPSISWKCSRFLLPESTRNKKVSGTFWEYKMETFPRNELIAFHISFFLLTRKGKKNTVPQIRFVNVFLFVNYFLLTNKLERKVVYFSIDTSGLLLYMGKIYTTANLLIHKLRFLNCVHSHIIDQVYLSH